MSWQLARWVWQLAAPLYIGMPPAGSLNRCRLYVPARALWGAITAALAQQESASFPPYRDIGEAVKHDTRLTYLYPAERLGTEWRAWLPRYGAGQGLMWQPEDSAAEARTERQMRQRLVLGRPATAIDPSTDAAADGSLRETECVGDRWRDNRGAVVMTGYVFIRQGAGLAAAIKRLDQLALGGDTRYGLGRLHRVEWSTVSNVFGSPVILAAPVPVVVTDRVLAHAGEAAGMAGRLELLSGWNRTGAREALEQVAPNPLWEPGSTAGAAVRWHVEDDGFWKEGEPV